MAGTFASELPSARPPSAPPVPLILVVSQQEAFLDQCRDAADVTDALVIECELRTVRSLADKWRPIAIVVPERTYCIDARLFEKIARRAGSRVIRIPGKTVAMRALERELLIALRQSYQFG